MASENVNIHIVERGLAAYAVVTADFTLRNPADEVTLKVGFPNWTHTVLADVYGFETTPYSPGAFSPQALSGFRASAGEHEYQASVQQLSVNPADRYGTDWYVWEMSFPSNSDTELRVSYEQKLTWDSPEIPPFVQPMYVLRTGALWGGPIGEGTVRMTADSGGAFLGGPEVFSYVRDDGVLQTLPASGAFLGLSDAVEKSEQQAVWRFHDLEPVADVGTTYVFRDVWTSLMDGEAALAAGTADGPTYERMTRDAVRLLGRWGPFDIPTAVLSRFPPDRVRGWARQAVEALPESSTAWEALGDIEHWFALPAAKHQGWFVCYPTQAEEAYRTAAGLGSATASEKLSDLALTRENQVSNSESPPAPCPNT